MMCGCGEEGVGIVFWHLIVLAVLPFLKKVIRCVWRLGLSPLLSPGRAPMFQSPRSRCTRTYSFLGHQELGLSALVNLSVRSGMNHLDFELGDQGRGIGRCGEENGQARSQRRNDENKPDRFNHKPFHLRGHLQ